MNIEFKRITLPNAPQRLVRADETPAPAPIETPAHVAEADDVIVVETPAPAPSVPSGADYPSLSTKFLLAGRAVFTVTNPKGDHYTFRVKKADSEWPAGSGQMRSTYFVSIKASGHTYPYAYIGMLNTKNGGIKCTAKSAYLPNTTEYKVAAWACGAVIEQKFIPAGYKIEHAGRCGKCGKELTDPVSIERGIGPDCWESLGN